MEEKKYSTPYRTYYPLAMRVLAVAVPGEILDWAAYIDSVPGECHDLEWIEVEKSGTKLSLKLASVLFPQFDPLRYRG